MDSSLARRLRKLSVGAEPRYETRNSHPLSATLSGGTPLCKITTMSLRAWKPKGMAPMPSAVGSGRGRQKPQHLRWLGPAGAAALAASAGIVRWSVTAVTAWLPAMALVEPLHGLTFALLHLACMQMLSVVVPPALAATAQGIYGGVAVGTMTAVMTLVSGPLYGALGPRAFWVMALLCAAALPIAFGMRGISISASGAKPI